MFSNTKNYVIFRFKYFKISDLIVYIKIIIIIFSKETAIKYEIYQYSFWQIRVGIINNTV